jgi:hypothetical protein
LTPVISTIVPGWPADGLNDVTDTFAWYVVVPQVLVTLTDWIGPLIGLLTLI